MSRRTLTTLCLIALMAFSGPALAKNLAGKKVLYIDSYHAGYEWSDGITEGVKETLEGTGVELKIHRMDTKRNKTEEDKKAAAAAAQQVIEKFAPDVVIASDDNAAKYLIMEYYRDAKLPFVFCGVNWDASGYGMPYSNTTGMLEVAGAKELVALLQDFAKGSRVALLADNTLSSSKDAENYKSKLGIDLTPVYASSLAEWKQKFAELQDQADILIIGNVVGISDFDQGDAEAYAMSKAKIPSGAVQVGSMPFAMIGYLKVAKEQGAWAAGSALKILEGTKASDIPVAMNTQGEIMINAKIASKVGVELSYELVQSASSVIE